MSDQIPYVESGTYVAYNNENSGVVECLKKDGIVDLDSAFQSAPDWVSLQAMINSWLADALTYELWVGMDGRSAYKIYYSDLSWPIGKVLFLKQVYSVKQRLGITKDNAEHREDEVPLFLQFSIFFLPSLSHSRYSTCMYTLNHAILAFALPRKCTLCFNLLMIVCEGRY